MHYHIIYHRPDIRMVREKGRFGTKRFRLVIAIDPQIDNIYLGYSNAGSMEWGSALWGISKQFKDLFRNIRSLEIRDVLWDSENCPWKLRAWIEDTQWSPLKRFTGLEELHLIPDKTVDDGPDADAVADYDWPGGDDWERCVESFHARFLSFAKKRPSTKVPKIYLHE